ncbi:uncharacterized protein N7498_007155 [Penicillium cinerascens]|uniref:Uncharacterized protein n=1 Tax=Penicillium cinerascens TaxID=70096 RepID=A0A9W9MDK4_9EURO|nr:uncharacterized protein N7498_007155 [Penicillium cinerascens]KAJ5198038.1 hypothetical protein N7498_007155 [Penicillium cinerascens]
MAELSGAPPTQLPSTSEPSKANEKPLPANLKELIEPVEEGKWPDFGFILFRTYFDDEELWDKF